MFVDEHGRIPARLTPAQKQQQFIKFVQQPPRWKFETKDSLELAVDILTVACAQPGSDSEIARACGANLAHVWLVMGSLRQQDLVLTDWGAYYAVPEAVDELLYRLKHDGRASWPEPEPPRVIDLHAAARQQARHQLTAALQSAGYRREGSSRLRVVK